MQTLSQSNWAFVRSVQGKLCCTHLPGAVFKSL